MQLRYMGLAMGIVAILLISGCTQEVMSFDCDYLSMGWIGEFMAKYYLVPEEAIQCDNEKGSFIMLTLDPEFAGDIAATMRNELIGIAANEQKDYYDEICSTSESFCAESLVASGGKINAVAKLEGNKVAIIAVNSDKPADAAAFLEGFWQNRNPTVS